jgi:hypothetical protein
MCVGLDRINEAMVTLKFDYMICSQIDHTYIISPYSVKDFEYLFDEFNINKQNFTILDDDYFGQYYDLSRWSHDNWYKQQAFKLCALDYFDSEYFLIQDCDLILLKPYSIWNSGKLNFKAEQIWNDHHLVYAGMVKEIIGLDRKIPYSLVNELMPYGKSDWQGLKEHIENVHGKNFLDAIADVRPFDETKWFSEYELLGIWKTNQSQAWTYFSNSSQPPIYTWDDFYTIDWKKCNNVKFHVQPLKFMNIEEAHKVMEYLTNVIS